MDNGASSYRRFRDTGDDSALIEIIRDYKDGLILYLLSVVGDIQTAEELAEDTFVLLGTKKPRDKGGSSFKTWLYTIGRNIAIDHLRRQKRRRNCEVPLDETVSMIDTELEKSFIREERKIILHTAMNKLKPEYRQVLWLVYFEGMSNKETSAVMKKSVHNIETLVSRARKCLRKQLETEGFDYEDL